MKRFGQIGKMAVLSLSYIFSICHSTSTLSMPISDGGKLIGTFSDLCRHPETGDLLGIEVSFIPSSAGLSVIFQRADGSIGDPVQLKVMQRKNNLVEVRSLESGGVQFNVNVLSAKEINLSFVDGQRGRNGLSVVHLTRRMPWWLVGSEKISLCN